MTSVPQPHAPVRWPHPLATAVWLLLLAADLFLVARLGSNVPWRDDWGLLGLITGETPDLPGWLWAPLNEHRLPLTKLLLWPLIGLFGGDLRASMVALVLLLAATAMGLMLTATKVRGRRSVSDMIFPLLLLHWGHQENLLLPIQLHMVLTGVLLCALVMLVTWSARLATGALVGLLIVALLLTVNGGTGLAAAPPVALLLIVAALATRSVSRRRALAVGVAAMLLAALAYITDLWPQPNRPPSAGTAAALRATFGFLGMAWGHPGALFAGVASGWMLVVGLVLTAGQLVVVAARRPDERVRATGLLAVLVGVVMIGVFIGLGRGGVPNGGLARRYVTLACPALVVIDLAWLLYGGPRAARLVTATLALAVLVALIPNTRIGWREARGRYARLVACEQDVRAGLSPEQIARRHARYVWSNERALSRGLARLREAGRGPYR